MLYSLISTKLNLADVICIYFIQLLQPFDTVDLNTNWLSFETGI